MKKIKLFLLLMMLCAGLGARAQELIDGIAYYLNDVHYTAEVTHLPTPDKYVGDIVVPEQVNYDGHDYAVTTVGPYAFSECTELTSVTLPATITEIVNYAFYGCSALTSVNIPEGITIIDENTFSDCSSLTSITLPESLTEIGYGAFKYCGLESITLPANVASIGGDAFAENWSLQTIHVQRTTPPTLGTDAFYYIPSDHVIYVPAESVELYKAADGWKELNIKAEGEPVYTWDWDFTDGVLTISGTGPMTDYDFDTDVPWYSVQKSITSVVIEDGITRIGNNAFDHCSNVASVAIPNSVISIGEYAFYACGMSSIIIPNNVETIEGYAFSHCYNLSTVTIGSGVKSIGQQAFAYDEALAVVTCNAMTPPTWGDDDVFYSVPSSCVIYVPAESVELYKAADGWKEMNIQIVGGVPEIVNGKLTVFVGEASDAHLPIYALYMDAFCRGQYIIPEANLANLNGQTIYGLKYYGSETVDHSYESTTDVYLKIVGNKAFVAPFVYEDKEPSDIVYTGNMKLEVNAITGKSEMTIAFDNPFSYTGGNLLIGMDNTKEGKFRSCSFYGTEVTYDAAVWGYSYTVLTSANINAKAFIPQTTFYVVDMSTIEDLEKADAVIALIDAIGSPITLESEPAIVAARTAYDALTDAQKALVTNYATLSAAEAALAELKDNTAPHDLNVGFTSGVVAISWEGAFDSYDLRMDKTENVKLSFGFDNDLEGWTSIDADGDGHSWEVGQQSKGFVTRNGSDGCAISASYDNETSSALTPDNWLVSPQVTLGGTMTLWATGEDKSYFAEHFAVYVSTTGKSVPADFVQVSPEYIIDGADNHKLYTVDLSAYSGEGYVAIRHFNCTDEFVLNIEDVAFDIPVTWQYEEGGYTDKVKSFTDEFFESANEYVFQVRGHKGEKVSDWAEISFVTPLSEEDKEAVAAVEALINAIGSPITFESEPAIVAARAAYDALKPAIKGNVTNYSDLQAAEKTLANLKGNIPLITDGWVHYDETGYKESLNGGGSEAWAILIPGNTVKEHFLTKVGMYVDATGDYTVDIVSGGATPANGVVLATEVVSLTNTGEFNEATLVNPVAIDPTQDIWVVFKNTSGIGAPISVSEKSLCSNARWISLDLGASWSDLADFGFGDVVLMIRAFFDKSDDEKAADAVIALIDAIGSPITLASEPAIVAARGAYDALTDAQKALVTNYATLSAAEAKLDQLKKQAAADQAAADLVIGKINAIGTVSYTTASKALIDAARGAYDALTDAQKALVTNYATLTAAEKAYADLKAQAEADQAAANVVIGQIDAIGEVTLASEPAIVAARGAYDALTDAQKALVTNYATLTAAEAKLEILKKQAESDEAAAAAVTDLINGIGAVSYTTESKALIDAAREAYNALTDAQKALVTNLSTLTAAEQVYEQLKAEAEADQKAANVVIDLIDQIGEVTLASEPAINAARTAYNSLTSIQQELVTNYGTLLAAETTLELLKQQATIDQAMADDVIARIEAIGEVTYTNNCYSRIFDARTAYDALSDVQKALVTNYATLTAAEARYADLKAQAEAVEEAKTQLKALVSEAAELKAIAMLYKPSAVEQIDAIIANAQQTIDDPNATVEDVNAKTEIIHGEIQFVGAALLEEAKEQLRQSIKALYQSGDYPSWYAAVIIPALNQVDEIMWDNDKTVQENILIFQTTGKAIYDTAKAALEALRASDTREIVSACEFTGFNGAITDGMMWNEAALNTLVANLNASAATQPYRFIAEECMLTKWNAEYELFVGVDHNESVVLTPGDYQFVANISIDGEDAAKFRFPKASEATLSVTVDAAVWSVDLAGILIDATYSSAYTTSPTFTLSEGQGIDETQDAQLKTQKIFHNGHFYILRGEHIYDLQGTLVR